MFKESLLLNANHILVLEVYPMKKERGVGSLLASGM
jgi:hypothetical protein